ncbi:hypothetical protein [Acerihabitans sp.]|uniref:hypothetical protein n=1 Tax=Acerihabitans sp. TaxID=2811394 RepID=UPI002ED80678
MSSCPGGIVIHGVIRRISRDSIYPIILVGYILFATGNENKKIYTTDYSPKPLPRLALWAEMRTSLRQDIPLLNGLGVA